MVDIDVCFSFKVEYKKGGAIPDDLTIIFPIGEVGIPKTATKTMIVKMVLSDKFRRFKGRSLFEYN